MTATAAAAVAKMRILKSTMAAQGHTLFGAGKLTAARPKKFYKKGRESEPTPLRDLVQEKAAVRVIVTKLRNMNYNIKAWPRAIQQRYHGDNKAARVQRRRVAAAVVTASTMTLPSLDDYDT
jgi:hypothetical protein